MHFQVCNFLRERQVQESVVEKFEEEKVSLYISCFIPSTPPGSVTFKDALKLFIKICLCVVMANQKPTW